MALALQFQLAEWGNPLHWAKGNTSQEENKRQATNRRITTGGSFRIPQDQTLHSNAPVHLNRSLPIGSSWTASRRIPQDRPSAGFNRFISSSDRSKCCCALSRIKSHTAASTIELIYRPWAQIERTPIAMLIQIDGSWRGPTTTAKTTTTKSEFERPIAAEAENETK